MQTVLFSAFEQTHCTLIVCDTELLTSFTILSEGKTYCFIPSLASGREFCHIYITCVSQKTLPHTKFAVVMGPVCLINVKFDCRIQCDDGSVAVCVDSCEDLL